MMPNLANMMFRPRTDGMRKAKWRNGRRVVSGWWEYVWQSDRFLIILNVNDRTTGAVQKRLTTDGDTPEWGNFKLVKED